MSTFHEERSQVALRGTIGRLIESHVDILFNAAQQTQLCLLRSDEGQTADFLLVKPTGATTKMPTDKPLSSWAWIQWKHQNMKSMDAIHIEAKSTFRIRSHWERSSGTIFMICQPCFPDWIFVIPRNCLYQDDDAFRWLPYAVHINDAAKLLQELASPTGPGGSFKNPTTGCIVKMWHHKQKPQKTAPLLPDDRADLWKISLDDILQFYTWFCQGKLPGEETDIMQVKSQPLGGDFVICIGDIKLTVQHKACNLTRIKSQWFQGAHFFHILLFQSGNIIMVFSRNAKKIRDFDMRRGAASASEFLHFLKKSCQQWYQDLFRDMSRAFSTLPLHDWSNVGRPETIATPLTARERSDPHGSSINRSLVVALGGVSYASPQILDGMRVYYYPFPPGTGRKLLHPWASGITVLGQERLADSFVGCGDFLLQLAKQDCSTNCILVVSDVREYPLYYEKKKGRRVATQRLFPLMNGFSKWKELHPQTPMTNRPFMFLSLDSIPSSDRVEPPMLLLPSKLTHVSKVIQQERDSVEQAAKTQRATWSHSSSKTHTEKSLQDLGLSVNEGVHISRYWQPASDAAARLHQMLANPDLPMSISRHEHATDFANNLINPRDYPATIKEVLQAMLDYSIDRSKRL